MSIHRRQPVPASADHARLHRPADTAAADVKAADQDQITADVPTSRRSLLRGLACISPAILGATIAPTLASLPRAAQSAPLKPGVSSSRNAASNSTQHRQGWPDKAIRLIIPTAPGSTPDRIGRAIADPMGRLLGQSVVAENRPGNHGNLAATLVAQAPADGYTLMLGTETIPTINLLLNQRNSLHPGDALIGINRIADAPFLLLIRADSPHRTLRQLLTRASRRPLRYGSNSGALANQLAVEWIKLKSNARQLEYLSYNNTKALFDGLASAEVALGCLPADMHALVEKDERIRLLALTSRRSNSLFPDTPGLRRALSVSEDFVSWAGLFAPGRTPEPLIARLNEALQQSLQSPQVLEVLRTLGYSASPMNTSEAFQQHFVSELSRNQRLLAETGLRLRAAP